MKSKTVRPLSRLPAAEKLEAMAATFRERNLIYGDNWRTVGQVLAALFPNGVTLKTEDDFIRWHFFDWIIGKMTRYANTGMNHQDSVHDAAVYLAMLEAFQELLDNAKQERSEPVARGGNSKGARRQKVGRQKSDRVDIGRSATGKHRRSNPSQHIKVGNDLPVHGRRARRN